MTVNRLREACRRTAEQRDAFTASKTDADLRLPTTALVRTGTRSFPLGVAMLQVCCHGTHHRAQAVNMLRHLGVPPPELDFIGWTYGGARPQP